MCNKRKADIVLRDKLVPGETYEVASGEPGAYARLLALLLAQAREDGMWRVAVGADEASGKTHLR